MKLDRAAQYIYSRLDDLAFGPGGGSILKPKGWYPGCWREDTAIIPSEVQLRAALDYYYLDADSDSERHFINLYLLNSIDIPKYIPERFERDKQLITAKVLGAYKLLTLELPQFRTIMDKALTGQRMSDADLETIDEAINYRGYRQVERDGTWVIEKKTADDTRELLKALYEVVVAVTQRNARIAMCALETCEKVFIQNPSGSEQKYCCDYHRVRAYQLRKRAVSH